MNDNDLEANININLDKSLDAAISKIEHLDKAWNKLANAPPIDMSQKVKTPAQHAQEKIREAQRKAGLSIQAEAQKFQAEEWASRSPRNRTESPRRVGENVKPSAIAPIHIGEPIKPGLFGSGTGPSPKIGMTGQYSESGWVAFQQAKHREEVKDLESGKTEVKTLSYSYDNLFKDELALISDKEKKEKFLSVMESKAFRTFRTAPASETGKYHPAMMNEQGGLLLHSKAVAQASLAIAADKGYTGNKDDLVLQALGHDMAKLNAQGRSDLYGHAKKAGEYFDEVGLPSSAIRSHMYTGKGNSLMGTLKPVTEEEKILKEADFLVSRTYAQDYIKAEDGKITGIDLAGLRKAALDKGDLTAVGGGGGAGEPPKEYTAASEASNERAKADKESEKSWHSILSSAGKFAKVLTGMGIAVGYAAMKATDKGSGLAQSGMSAFTGMTSGEILDNELREKKIKAGAGSLNAEIQALAEKRAAFQRTGKADIFATAQFGQVGNLLLSKDPMQDVYAAMMDELAAKVKAENDPTKKEGMMGQIRSELGPSSAKMINFMIEQKQTYAQSGQRYKPGNDGWLDSSVGIDAEMQMYLNSIKNSFSQILTAFQDFAGNPILKAVADVVSAFVTGKNEDGSSSSLNSDVTMGLSRAKGYAKYNATPRAKQLNNAWDAYNFKGTVSEFADQARSAGVDLKGYDTKFFAQIQAAVKAQLQKEQEAAMQKMVEEDLKKTESQLKGKSPLGMGDSNTTNYLSLNFPNATRASEIRDGIQQAMNMSTSNAMNNLYVG